MIFKVQKIDLYPLAKHHSNSAVALVAFHRNLGCLEPGLSSTAPQLALIDSVNESIKAGSDMEFDSHLWKLFPTKDYRLLEKHHEIFRV